MTSIASSLERNKNLAKSFRQCYDCHCSTHEHSQTSRRWADEAISLSYKHENMNDETTYKLFKAIEDQPTTNQRRLASELEISLGKLNYCLKALLDKGLVKVENFIESDNKRGYLYRLTPAGLSAKATVTLRFLKHKMSEYEKLKHEIQALKEEIETQGSSE